MFQTRVAMFTTIRAEPYERVFLEPPKIDFLGVELVNRLLQRVS